jgi:ABC-type uncharacterized transport system permease subunit
VAIILHGYTIYFHLSPFLDSNGGVFTMFMIATWIAMLMVMLRLIQHTSPLLLLLILPIAMISLFMMLLLYENPSILSEQKIMHGNNWLSLSHRILGMMTLGIFLLAGLQSSMILYVDHQLRHHPEKLTPIFPSLQNLERYLSRLLQSGFLLLSFSLIFVYFFSGDLNHTQTLHKVVLTLASWVILTALMIGHYWKGWRGILTAKWTLMAVLLLLIGYFGSKLAIEFFLRR